jgi:hypothetical protein
LAKNRAIDFTAVFGFIPKNTSLNSIISIIQLLRDEVAGDFLSIPLETPRFDAPSFSSKLTAAQRNLHARLSPRPAVGVKNGNS